MATLAGVWGRSVNEFPLMPVEEPNALFPRATVMVLLEELNTLLAA